MLRDFQHYTEFYAHGTISYAKPVNVDVADNFTPFLYVACSVGVKKFAQLSNRGYDGVGSTVRRKNCTAAHILGPRATHFAFALTADTGSSPEFIPFGWNPVL
jgi:hypothetical protein